jgi:hypothetical protein
MDRSIARRLIVTALALGVAGQSLFVGYGAGLNVTVLVCLTLATVLLARPRRARIDPVDAWIPVSAVLFSIFVAVRGDATLIQADTAAALMLLGASAPALAGVPVTRGALATILGVGGRVGANVMLGASALLLAAHLPIRSPDPNRRRGIVAVARGLALASPVLLVFAALFASADAVFARSAADVLTLNVDLGDAPVRLAIAVALAWPVAGLLLLASGNEAEVSGLGSGDRTAPGTARRRVWRLGTTEALVVLVAVDLLVGAFVGLQLTYLFGGHDTLAVAGMTYSTYARRGFFELVAATALAVGLVAAVAHASERRVGSIGAAAIALLALTCVVLASAALRLRLYQDAYGWTQLRFYIDVAIAWLGLGIVASAALLVRNRMERLPHAMAGGALAAALVVNVVGPQAFVADRNLERAANPALVPPGGRTGLDAAYLASLDDDAVPRIVGALPTLPPGARSVLEQAIQDREQVLADPGLTGWPAWNLGRERARAALAAVGLGP